MIELQQKTHHLKLAITGFQFKKSVYQEDLDWLTVSLEAQDPEIGFWQAVGPYLRVKEVQEISEWLKAIADGREVDGQLNFLENELAFEFDIPTNTLIIQLDFGFHPKGESYEYGQDQAYHMNFHLTSSSLKQLIYDIDQIPLSREMNSYGA